MALLTTPQRIDRIETRVGEMRLWRNRAHFELREWESDGERLSPGDPWPRVDGLVRFAHPEVVVPAEWPLGDVRLQLDFGGEGVLRLLYGEGREVWGLDVEHQEWPLRDRRFSVEVEAVARLLLGRPNAGARLERSRLVVVEPGIQRLSAALAAISATARALGDEEVVDPLLECAERACARLEWPSATEPYLARQRDNPWMQTLWTPLSARGSAPPLSDTERESVERAGQELDAELQALKDRYPARGRLALTGHAHLDVAWLWPLQETRRKAVRTFHTASRLIDRYDDFRFNASSAQIYRFVEEEDSDLFKRVRAQAAEGRWEPIGGMWVEPDMNMPCGESIVRQLLYGQRYFQSRFGDTHRVCWLPDCFGFTPGLPQLLLDAGIDSFLTIKVNWSEMNRFPYDLFWWEGLDGSRVLAHTFDNPDVGYNARATPAEVIETWSNYRGKTRHPESLLSVGYGNGGGGVTPEIIERVHTLQNLPAVPVLTFSSVHEFFARARGAAEGADVPTWVGELYLEFHRGTLTTQGRTKWLHRRAERDLIASETLAGMVALAGGPVHRTPEERWHRVLRNEFHDVLPGSGVGEIYEDSERELAGVVDESGAASDQRVGELADRVAPAGDRAGVFVVNPDLSARPLRVQIDTRVPGAQPVERGFVLTDEIDVAGLSAVTVCDPQAPSGLRVSSNELENAYVRVRLAPDGTLESVFDKRADREALDDRGNQLWAYVDKPRAWDAWDVDVSYTDAAQEIVADRPAQIVEEGPHRVALRVERGFRDSLIVQDLRLWANSPRLDVATVIDWHDRRFMIKARFPLAVRATHASFETAFGVVERPTYRNTSWDTAQFEVPGHRFADLSEPGFGVSLLNDGRYGHHALRNELGLTLLRSPIYPHPRADEGRHSFTYSLLPHIGTLAEGDVLAEAEDLNRPLFARAVQDVAPGSWSALRVAGVPLALGALKAAEEQDALILRVYEPYGARGTARIELPEGWEMRGDVDLLERRRRNGHLDFSPFRVRSWLLGDGARKVRA